MTIAGVVGLHVVAFALFLIGARAIAPPVSAAKPMVMFDVATAKPTQQSVPPPPALIISKVPTKKLTLAPPSLENEEQGVGAPGEGCATLSTIDAAIKASPETVAQIQSAPPELRSISDAVVVWNAGWAAGTQVPTEPLAWVRYTIETALKSVEPGCLNEEVIGPRLIGIPTGDHNMYVVLGSGRWSWAQMFLSDGEIQSHQGVQSASPIPWPKPSPAVASEVRAQGTGTR